MSDHLYSGNHEEYKQLVGQAYNFMRKFWIDNMSMDLYMPIVKDNPENVEYKLNMMQWYCSYIQNSDAPIEVKLESVMHVTQTAFMLGYIEGKSTDPDIGVFKEL